MIELKCKSCGSPLVDVGNGKYKCEYCGTLYKDEIGYLGRNLVEVCNAKTERLCAEVSVPFDMNICMDDDDLSNYTLDMLTHKLAEGLAAFMKLSARKDLRMNATIVRGEVRVVQPDFRF